MRAIVQAGYGAPERVLRLAGVPRPVVGEHDVLVRVLAASVNTPDCIAVAGEPYVLRAMSGLRGPRTAVRGTDLAGVVEVAGPGVTDLGRGDEVFGSSETKGLATPSGSFAELAAAPAMQLAGKPAGVTFEEAAASVMSGITALIAMRDTAGVNAGTRVMVVGASGGVGTFAVQIAKALGAEVTGVCSGRNAVLVRSLGADHVIDYTTEDITRGGRRYDVILDNVLSHPAPVMARRLVRGGVLIPNSAGTTGGLLGGLPRIARAGLMRLGSGQTRFVTCAVTRENLTALGAMLEDGRVRAVIDGAFPLEDAPAAVSRMLGHHAAGNVVISVSGGGGAA